MKDLSFKQIAKVNESKAAQYGFAALSNEELLSSIGFKGGIEEYWSSYNYKANKELMRRFESPKAVIKSSLDAYKLFEHLNENEEEMFFIAVLNRANKVLDRLFISKGSEAGTVVGIKQIAKLAIERTAAAIILCHNHPSGNNKPSDEDLRLTKKVKDALELFDIKLIDHVIICRDNNYYSFADEGKI